MKNSLHARGPVELDVKRSNAPLNYHTMTTQQDTVTTTYAELRQYFTEQELDDAAIIARYYQHHEQHLTYAEIFIQILLEMRR
jgi:hypothetical protein